MPIRVTYNDDRVVCYDNFNKITDNINVIKINCNNNNLTSLPANMNYPNLTRFYCSNNNLTSLPDNMIFPNLKHFNCSDNNLTSLPDNMNFPNLRYLHCHHNKLYYIPPHINCYISTDDMTKSPEYMRRKIWI